MHDRGLAIGLGTLRMAISAMGASLVGVDQAAHEPALHEDDDGDGRQHHDQGGRHRQMPGGRAAAGGQLVGDRSESWTTTIP
jgi:hypothetical protein